MTVSLSVPGDWTPGPRPKVIETGDQHRKDEGKVKGFYLMPTRALREMARLYKIGADKYQPRGWERGMEWSRIWDPAFRHLLAWLDGERYDPVDGQHHLAAVAWACFALIEYEETHPELNDIHPGKLQPEDPALSEVSAR